MPHVQLPAGIPLQSAATLVTGPITQGSTQYQQPPPQIYQVPPGLTPPTVSHVPLPLKHVEPPTYTPKVRKIVSFGGIETPIFELALKSFEKPDALNVGKFSTDVCSFKASLYVLGTLDLYRITMSLRSLLEPEVKYALDALLVISCQKQPLISLMKWTDLLTSLLSCMECCIEGAFGVLDKSPKKIRHVKESLYTTMYENEEREIEDLHDLGLKTLEDERVGHAERVLAMSTIFSNFAFQPDNALFLAKNERFRDIILSLLIVTRQTCIPGMTSRQAGLLEHRKNLITLLSNIGSHYSIQPAYGQLYVDIVADFISHEGSVYAYIALEAFAKLTLLEQNHDAVLECDGLDAIIRCIKGCFPSSGLSLETTPETAASWELASLLFFNLTDMRDDSVIASLIKEPGLVQLLIRVIESGIRVGHDHHADFIRIITCRLLKSLSSLFRSHESNGNFSKYETQLVNLLMSVGQSNITQGFQKDASQSLMECLETLSPQD